MLKSRKARWTVAVLGLLLVGVALATHYGTYFCGSCTLEGATPDPDTVSFITTDVNQDVAQWRAGDTVTICNGDVCATYKLVSVIGGITGMQQVAKFSSATGGGGSTSYYYYGGGAGPSGCIYGCNTGTVTVGDPERAEG